MSAKTTNPAERRTPLAPGGGSTAPNDKGCNSSNSSAGRTSNTKLENKNGTEKQQTNDSNEQQAAALPKENSTKLQNIQTAIKADSKSPKKQPEKSSAGQTKSSKLINQNNKTQQLSVKNQQQPENGESNNLKTAENEQEQVTKAKQQNSNDEKMISSESGSTQAKQDTKEKDKTENDAKKKNKVEQKSDKDKHKQQNDKMKQEPKKDKEILVDNFYTELKQKEHSFIENKSVIAKCNSNDNKDSDEVTTKVGNVVGNTIATSHQQGQQHNNNATKRSTVKIGKQSTPKKPTSSKNIETPQKRTPTDQEVTASIDDYEMESLKDESSPSKPEKGKENNSSSTSDDIHLQKSMDKSESQLVMQPSVSAEHPFAFSRISGRRAIHPIASYTPSNLHLRRTEMDITNTSLNATLGSETSNDTSISLLPFGRKRCLTQQQQPESTMDDIQNNGEEISPYKRARMTFLRVVASPMSMLRNRFSEANLKSSTPVVRQQNFEENEDDDGEVQNVSSESVLEDLEKFGSEPVGEGGKHTSFQVEATTSNKMQNEGDLEIHNKTDKEFAMKEPINVDTDNDGIQITEKLYGAGGKNKRCIVM